MMARAKGDGHGIRSAVGSLGRVVVARLAPGTELLTALERLIDEHGIRYGLILGGAASLRAATLRNVTAFPAAWPFPVRSNCCRSRVTSRGGRTVRRTFMRTLWFRQERGRLQRAMAVISWQAPLYSRPARLLWLSSRDCSLPATGMTKPRRLSYIRLTASLARSVCLRSAFGTRQPSKRCAGQ